MSDEAPTGRSAWIYTYDGPSARLISRRRATPEEIEAMDARLPVGQELAGPEGSPADGPPGGESLVAFRSPAGAPARPRFEHDPAARVFRLTAADGTVETFRDSPIRYLCVEPDPETGAMRPVMKHGRPVYLRLAREDREAR